MTEIRNNPRFKKILITTIFAVLALASHLLYLCTVNYQCVHGPESDVVGKIHPTDLDLDWYVMDKDSDRFDKIVLSTDEYERWLFYGSGNKAPYVELSGNSGFDQSVDFTKAPYKLHIVRCEMADEESRRKGLYVTIDSYMDSNEVTHKETHTLFYDWDKGAKVFSLWGACYKKYIPERFGTCSIPILRVLSYMPISEPDPYVGGYYNYWSDYWVHVRVILIVYVTFTALAVFDKPENFRFVKIMRGLSIFYSVWFFLLGIPW